MAVYITGDTHGEIDWSKLSMARFPEQRQMTRDDIVIIAGDFGGVWDDANHDRYIQKTYGERQFTTAFIDGNHENHWLLSRFPVEKWNGGMVHRISDAIVHLMRGEVYTMQGKTFFCMGGADSHDKEYRTFGISWWPEELPNMEEYDNALKNLAAHDFNVDYVVTHDCPTSILAVLYKDYHPVQLNEFFDHLEQDNNLSYDHWYFGHHHIDRELGTRHTALYHKVIKII